MNTDVSVDGACGLAPWFAEVEDTLSRFDPRSSLSQLNRNQGRWTLVPLLLLRAVQAALKAAAVTGGAFDPTILDALEAAGYSRSFELGPAEPAQGPATPAGRWAEVQIAQGIGAIWLPIGVRLDLGGIGKGLAVDGAMSRARTLPRVLINAGGDIALRTAADDPPILVDVEDPFDPERTLATFALHQGAVATSSTMGRRWGAGVHHIIDPRTGRPSASGLVAATVIAPTAVRAEVLAKACIVLGPLKAQRLLRTTGCHGLLMTEHRMMLHTPGMEVNLHAES